MNDEKIKKVTDMMQNPITLIAQALILWLKGRVHFLNDLDNIRFEDGDEEFVAFRKVVVEPVASQPIQSGAIFQVRFSFKNLSLRVNRLLSLIPIPLIVSQPGVRSKTWLLGQETGDFIGLYEFDTVEKAEAYWNSLPLKMMRLRAVPGSLTQNVQEQGAPLHKEKERK